MGLRGSGLRGLRLKGLGYSGFKKANVGLYVALLWLKVGIMGCCGAFLCGQTGVCRAGLI